MNLHVNQYPSMAIFQPRKTQSPKYDQMESRIAGIPCLIEINRFSKVKGDSSTWASDWDYYGYTECEFTVLDRKGYVANWLVKKMTRADSDRIESEIEDFKGEQL